MDAFVVLAAHLPAGAAPIPFMARDLDVAAGWDARWPVRVEAFTQYARQVERIFELTETPYEIPEVLGRAAGASAAFVPRLAKWPPFINRNMATLLRRDIQRESGPEIWLGATVCEFSLEPSGRLGSVAAKSLNGRRLSIKPREVVFAAGAIESTRLLLLVDRQHDDRLFQPHGILGRYFYDHLSVPTSRVFVRDARRLNQITGFRFEGKTMRNLRFEPSFELRKQHGLPTGFAHISFVSELPSGFDALRSILRGRQEGKLPSVRDATLLASSVPWLASALWWRMVEKRLSVPPAVHAPSAYGGRAAASARNRIALSSDRADVFGSPLATIDWRVGETAAEHSIALTKHFLQFWANSVLAPLARLELEPTPKIIDGLKSGGRIYHPAGRREWAGVHPRRS